MEDEEVKKIADLREIIENRIKNLESEVTGLKSIQDFINKLLAEKSFRRAEEISKPLQSRSLEENKLSTSPKRIVKTEPLKTKKGEILANLRVEKSLVRITPAVGKNFNITLPPFTTFLVERILMKIKERDQQLFEEGKILKEKIFSYTIKTEEQILKEIIFRNFNSKRKKELQSSIRWTLEKMYEKTKSNPI